MKSDILAYIPCAYLYGECHKYPLEMLACLHGCSSQATQNGFASRPSCFLTPSLCNKETQGLCDCTPLPETPYSFQNFYLLHEKTNVLLCTRQERPSVLGKKLFWSFVHTSSSSILSQTHFPKHSLYIKFYLLNLKQTNLTKLRYLKERSRKKNNFKGCVS